MARQRLSWVNKQADPYTMNQDHPNPPVSKYQTGNPSTWAEDPHMATPWKTEGRTETGHPAPAREAVVAARKLEDKAIKCITIAQRMLPGAADEIIEEQATDLMYLPERSIMATLQRQSVLAEEIVTSGKKMDDDDDDEADKSAKGEKEMPEEEEEKSAAKDEKEMSEEEEEKSAAKKKDMTEEEEAEKAAAKGEKEMPEEEEEKSAAKKKDETQYEEEEKSAAKKKDETEYEEKKKSSGDLLDHIFAEETPEQKQGAKKLSGIVKQASAGGDPLANLWEGAPDVSKVFK